MGLVNWLKIYYVAHIYSGGVGGGVGEVGQMDNLIGIGNFAHPINCSCM